VALYFFLFKSKYLFFQSIFNFLGLSLFDVFGGRTQLKGSPLLAPFICLRVVTRGDYPELVRSNLARNLETCQKVSMENYLFEVVTDKRIDLPESKRVRQVCYSSDPNWFL